MPKELISGKSSLFSGKSSRNEIPNDIFCVFFSWLVLVDFKLNYCQDWCHIVVQCIIIQFLASFQAIHTYNFRRCTAQFDDCHRGSIITPLIGKEL